MVGSLLFSFTTRNDANVIFITCNSLNNARNTSINVKLHKKLGVINLTKIIN